ncbi:MAG: DUF819 family protein [Spirochaetales bacterium]|nr:DUF819 family protein [Spirochaetales bacterium]
MTETLILSASLFAFPVGVRYLRTAFPLFKRINPIIGAYLFGLILVNSGIIGEEATPLLDTIATVTVALSIPLMLFSVNIRTWFKESEKTGFAMILAALAITIALILGRFIFAQRLEEFPRLAGMLVGVYTGGTPNLAAIRSALSVPADLYLAVHASDILLSSLYLMFVITLGQPLLSRVLRKEEEPDVPGKHPHGEEELTPLKEIFTAKKLKPLAAALGLALLIFGLGASCTLFVGQESQTLVVILVITTLSLLASLNKKVREIPDSFAFGEYFIIVFSASTGAMGDFSRILGAAPGVFLFVAFALFVSMIIHILLCRIFRIDVDTMLISSTAAICSPPFVGVTGIALKRPSLIGPGITAGLMGYAMGNYLGVLMYKLISL